MALSDLIADISSIDPAHVTQENVEKIYYELGERIREPDFVKDKSHKNLTVLDDFKSFEYSAAFPDEKNLFLQAARAAYDGFNELPDDFIAGIEVAASPNHLERISEATFSKHDILVYNKFNVPIPLVGLGYTSASNLFSTSGKSEIRLTGMMVSTAGNLWLSLNPEYVSLAVRPQLHKEFLSRLSGQQKIDASRQLSPEITFSQGQATMAPKVFVNIPAPEIEAYSNALGYDLLMETDDRRVHVASMQFSHDSEQNRRKFVNKAAKMLYEENPMRPDALLNRVLGHVRMVGSNPANMDSIVNGCLLIELVKEVDDNLINFLSTKTEYDFVEYLKSRGYSCDSYNNESSALANVLHASRFVDQLASTSKESMILKAESVARMLTERDFHMTYMGRPNTVDIELMPGMRIHSVMATDKSNLITLQQACKTETVYFRSNTDVSNPSLVGLQQEVFSRLGFEIV